MDRTFLFLFAGTILVGLTAQAQDQPSEEQSTAAETQAEEASAVAVDPEMSLDELKLRLVPLTLSELETAAGTWRDAIRSHSEESVELMLESTQEGASDEDKKSLAEQIDERLQVESKLLDRLGLVLDSWEVKGGDPKEFKDYIAAIRGAGVSVEKPSTIISAVRRWFESEDGAIRWLFKGIILAVILLVFWVISLLASRGIGHALDRHERSSELLDRFVTNVTRRLILVIGLLVGLSTLGVNVGALLAMIGGGAFIIGLALQDTLSNFANGVMLMIYQPFDKGSAVEIGGVTGVVQSVSLVNTKIHTFDNKVVMVPNKSVWGQIITNINGASKRRVDMVFGIGYDDDIDEAQAILEKIVAADERILEEPEPTIKMNELADSSVNFVCRPWVKTSDWFSVLCDVTKQVKLEFDKAGIGIPYPQQDVHLHGLEAISKPEPE